MLLSYFFQVQKKRYGARIRLAICTPRYCHCNNSSCTEGPYTIQETVIRIKKDEDLKHLHLFLQSQYNIWDKKVIILDDSTDSTNSISGSSDIE